MVNKPVIFMSFEERREFVIKGILALFKEITWRAPLLHQKAFQYSLEDLKVGRMELAVLQTMLDVFITFSLLKAKTSLQHSFEND